MTQKVIQVGNSIGIIIPQVLSRDLGIKAGDNIVLEKKGEKVVISKEVDKKQVVGGVDAKFMEAVDSFIVDHKDVLEELARR